MWLPGELVRHINGEGDTLLTSGIRTRPHEADFRDALALLLKRPAAARQF
ncbi:MAG: hypothetical protein OXC69_01795 [Candidatus Tectomicrobia bacterium]|nr:hypothetical protein [Candidatus Tectomicrobia bacterium]